MEKLTGVSHAVLIKAAINIVGLFFSLLMRVIGKKRHFKASSFFLINTFVFYFLISALSWALSLFEIASLNKAMFAIEMLALAFALIKTAMFVILDIFLFSRKGIEVPTIIRDTLFVIVYIILLMLMLKETLNINIASIITTSAVLTMVLGLAIQDNLGNLFSGLAIQLEKPFSIGEWIKFENTMGKVKELSWRSVKLLTLDDDLLIIPNNKIIKETITNYNRPTQLHISKFNVGVSYKHPPNTVKEAIVSVLKNDPDVSPEPKPHVRLIHYGEFSITYEVRYYITNFNKLHQIDDSIATKLWYAFQRNKIEVPYPIRDVRLQTVTDETERKHKEEKIDERLAILNGIDFLAPLKKTEMAMLAQTGRRIFFCAGEEVIKEGDYGDSLFLIISGAVDVSINVEQGKRKSVATLRERNFFGERAMLTGEKRNATITAITDCVLFIIDKETFKNVLSNHEETVKKISEILTERELDLKSKKQEATKQIMSSHIQENSKKLFQKIMDFLGL